MNDDLETPEERERTRYGFWPALPWVFALVSTIACLVAYAWRYG